MKKSLKQKFLEDNNDRVISAKEIFEWYTKNKENPDLLPDRSVPYRIIIEPLLHSNLIKKLGRGKYLISAPAELMSTGDVDVLDPSDADLEFERYLSEKLK